jgi:hypothetical protein
VIKEKILRKEIETKVILIKKPEDSIKVNNLITKMVNLIKNLNPNLN